MNLCLHVIVNTSQIEALANALVSILQIILTHKSDMNLACSHALLFKKVVPRFHSRCLAYRDSYLAQNGGVKSLPLHAHGHLVNAGHVFALHHAFQINITERSHLQAQGVVEVAFGAKDKNVWLYAHALQFLYRVLRWLCLQFVCRLQIRHIRQVHAYRIAPQLPAQLTDSLHERSTLNVAYGASHFGDDKVESIPKHPPLYLVRDMRHHLDGLAKIVAMTLAVDNSFVNPTCGNAVVPCCLNTCKPFIVTQIEVCFHTVSGNVALAMFIRVQRSWVNVDVRVELLNGYLVTTCLQQFANRGGNNAFS